MILANAVYLHAYWARQFKAKDVSPRHLPQSRRRRPGAVHAPDRVAALQRRGRDEAVELPYRSSTLAMMVMLPSARSLAALEQGLGATALSRIAARMRPAEVELALPKFHLEVKSELAGVLSALGMPDAFSQAADFSRIDPGEQLDIARISHAADIEVQEEGTVAAAATIVEIEATALEVTPPARPFIADRPFLYFLRDRRTGAILFAGRLVNAAGAQA